MTVLFEKRVLSRFSNRQIYLYPTADETEEKTRARRGELMKLLLSVPNQEHCIHKKEWNDAVEELCEKDIVKDCIQNLITMTKCESMFRNFLVSS